METKLSEPTTKISILNQLDNMSTILDVLGKTISELEGKLEPLMPQTIFATGKESETAPDPSMSMVAKNLVAYQMKVSSYINRINSLLGNIEL